MRWSLLAACGAAIVIIAALKIRRSSDQLSTRWMREQLQKSARVQYDGVTWTFPVNKLLNEEFLGKIELAISSFQGNSSPKVLFHRVIGQICEIGMG